MAKTPLLLGLASVALTLGGAALAADIPEACNSYKAAVTGGPLPPPESDTVVIRWLANANFEFGYRGKVYLFDAYFDRTPRSRMLGFKAADVSKAEAIFISHAHFDHISDIGPVARQTGAPVVGAPITAETAKKLGAQEKQIVVAKGGETMKFGDATVEIALAEHSTIQPGLLDIYASLYSNDSPPYSDQEKTLLGYVRSLGTFDPKIITEGTLAYGLVFPSGFKAVLIGSAGPITPGLRTLADKLGPVDVALDGIEPLTRLIAADHAAVAGAGRIDEHEVGEIEPGLRIGHEGGRCRRTDPGAAERQQPGADGQEVKIGGGSARAAIHRERDRPRRRIGIVARIRNKADLRLRRALLVRQRQMACRRRKGERATGKLQGVARHRFRRQRLSIPDLGPRPARLLLLPLSLLAPSPLLLRTGAERQRQRQH